MARLKSEIVIKNLPADATDADLEAKFNAIWNEMVGRGYAYEGSLMQRLSPDSNTQVIPTLWRK